MKTAVYLVTLELVILEQRWRGAFRRAVYIYPRDLLYKYAAKNAAVKAILGDSVYYSVYYV